MTAVVTPSPAGFGSVASGPIARRTVLTGAAASVLVATMARVRGHAGSEPVGSPAATGAPAAPAVPATIPGVTAFAAVVGSAFTVESGLRGHRVVLDEAVDLTVAPRPNEALTAGEHFSLVFRGPAGRTLPGRIRTIRHPSLGRIELFLQPVGRGIAGQDYQAIIDQRRLVGR